jgi:hypothetical protein
MGFKWQPEDHPSVRGISAPELREGDVLLYDEPGRCGGLDCHSHHYRIVMTHGTMFLLVRHGGGDERIRLSCAATLKGPLAAMDSTARYWLLSALYHAQEDAARNARDATAATWRLAAAEKRIKTRKQHGGKFVKVWIESSSVEEMSAGEACEGRR